MDTCQQPALTQNQHFIFLTKREIFQRLRIFIAIIKSKTIAIIKSRVAIIKSKFQTAIVKQGSIEKIRKKSR
jgi:hypothetical protein